MGSFVIGNDRPLAILAGPCQLESREHAFEMADALTSHAKKLNIPFIFKSSFDKANRTSAKGARGVGMEKGLEIFKDIKARFGCPIVTDVHTPEQAHIVADVVDMLQTPAFLCRQTDFLLAVGKTGKPINVKKGQFLAPWDMAHVAEKIASTGNDQILLCERGVSFGYNNLVVDMRGFPIMAKTGYPVVLDATHAVMQPGGAGDKSSGQREFAPVLARAAVAVGVAAVFMETHQDPDNAPSDGPNMIHLKDILALWSELKELDTFAKKNPICL